MLEAVSIFMFLQLCLSLLLGHCSYSAGYHSDNVNIEGLQESARDPVIQKSTKTPWNDDLMIPKNFDSQLDNNQNGHYHENAVHEGGYRKTSLQDGRQQHENANHDGSHRRSAIQDDSRRNGDDRAWQSVQLASRRKYFYLAPGLSSFSKTRPKSITAFPGMPSIGAKAITIAPPVVIPLDIGDHNARTADNSIARLLGERRVGAVDVYRPTDQQIAIDNGDDADADNSINPLLLESHPGAISAVRTTETLIENAGLGFPIIDPNAIDADDPDVLRIIESPRRPKYYGRNRKERFRAFFQHRLEQGDRALPDKNGIFQTKNKASPKEHQVLPEELLPMANPEEHAPNEYQEPTEIPKTRHNFPMGHQELPTFTKEQTFRKEQQGYSRERQILPAELFSNEHQVLPAELLRKTNRDFPKMLRYSAFPNKFPKTSHNFPMGHQEFPKFFMKHQFGKEQEDYPEGHQVLPAEFLPNANQDFPKEHQYFSRGNQDAPNGYQDFPQDFPNEYRITSHNVPIEHQQFPNFSQAFEKDILVQPSDHQDDSKMQDKFSQHYRILADAIRQGNTSSQLDSFLESLLELRPYLDDWVHQRYGIDAAKHPNVGLGSASMLDNLPQGIAKSVLAKMIANKQPLLSIMSDPEVVRNSLQFMGSHASLVQKNVPNKIDEIQWSVPITAYPESGPDYPIDSPPGATNKNFPESTVAEQFPLPITTVAKPANDFSPINTSVIVKNANGKLVETMDVNQVSARLRESSSRMSTKKIEPSKWFAGPIPSKLKTSREGQVVTGKYPKVATRKDFVLTEKKSQNEINLSTKAGSEIRATAFPFPELGPRVWSTILWTISPMGKDEQWQRNTESSTKAFIKMEKNGIVGMERQFGSGDWTLGTNDTGSDDYNGCFTSGRYITSLEWIEFFHKDTKLIAMAVIAVALFLLVFITTICIIRIYHRQKHSCRCVNLNLHCRLADVQLAVRHLSYSQREKLSKLMYDKLIEDGLTHLSRYFDGIGKLYSKQMDFNLLFDDLAPTFNLHNLTEVNRSQNSTPAQNIDLNDGLEHFLYGERQN